MAFRAKSYPHIDHTCTFAMPVRIRNASLHVSGRFVARRFLGWIYVRIARKCLYALEESKYKDRVRECWESVRSCRLSNAIYEERALEQALVMTGMSNPDWVDHLAITIESMRFLMECDAQAL